MARASAGGPRQGARPRRVSGLGPALCWAVVFADLGTSGYYTPGILFTQFGAHAALFVALTLVVFVLLAIKYAEVTVRYPEGGGVVAVGAHAVNRFVGLVGGLFILVDYFLTSSLSAVSGITYLATVIPFVLNLVVPLTIVALVVIAALNLYGVSADAKVTAVIAAVALVSQLAVVIAVVVHAGVGDAVGAIPRVFAHPIGGVGLLTGYAGAFLAFSGLESISQLSPAMAEPRRRVAPRTMVLVIVTVALTSPLLTLWSTTLLDSSQSNPNQFISLLGGYAGGALLRTEVALTAALLLIFASNTATIGCYHVFLALSKMRFLPELLQRRNRLRDTPHWAIFFATLIPCAVVIASRGSAGTLGDLYAFGLLGAFSVTCVCLDIVRWHERHRRAPRGPEDAGARLHTSTPAFAVGVATSLFVVLAWTTNLFAKPMATLFGGTVTALGLIAVGITQWRRRRRDLPGLVPHADRLERMHRPPAANSQALIVLLPADGAEVEALVDAAFEEAGDAPALFLYLNSVGPTGAARHLREIIDPYLADAAAHRLIYAAATGERSSAATSAAAQLKAGRMLLLEGDAGGPGPGREATRRGIRDGSTRMQLWQLPEGIRSA